MEDLRQNKLWLEYCKNKGNKVVEIPSKSGGVIFGILIPLGFGLNLLKIQRAFDDPDWEKLTMIKRRNRVISTVIEPQGSVNKEIYRKNGYKLSNFPYLATKTVVVDLRQSIDQMWTNLSENARRLVKKNEQLRIKEVLPEEFLEIWKPNSKIWTTKLSELIEMKKILGDKVRFLVSFLDQTPQSGILLIETKDTANYLHSFTTDNGRRSGAHFKMVWEVLKTEKERSLQCFDFEGIYDKRWPQKRWLGFTEFKNKFGGKAITFPGSFHKWL